MPDATPLSVLDTALKEHEAVLAASRSLTTEAALAAEMVGDAIAAGNKVLLCGNGGSASDAQHIAGELVGRFLLERPGFAAIALNSDTTTLTAIGNDYGYEAVFERPLRALGRAGDVLVAYSTSGNSPNVLRAAKAAQEIGMKVIGMTGQTGGALNELCDVCLAVPSRTTARIQEMHILFGHAICQIAEARLTAAP